MVSSAQSIENFNAIAYETVHRHTQNVPNQKIHRNSETDYIEHNKRDDDASMANRLSNTYESGTPAIEDKNFATVGDDYVDNVSTSNSHDTKSCLRKRITKSVPKSSPKMHCNKPPSSATTCDIVQPTTTTLRQTSPKYERDMSALHRPQFASGAKMKKIVFNGTFPIDDPYSSRFEYDGHLLQ